MNCDPRDVRSPNARHVVVIDVLLAVGFAVLDTTMTLVGASWWPEHPGSLAWTMLAVQAAACLSLVARRRAPMTVVAVLAGFTLAVTVLISPTNALDPAHTGGVWAPFATALASYAPVQYCRNRRVAFFVVAALTVVVARPWDPSLVVITIGLTRTMIGPLLAMYFDARRRLIRALTERAERAECEQHLLAEQARAEERARLAGEMHDLVTRHITLMVMQAGALRVTGPDESTRRAAEELRAAGCRALDELRDLVGILRAPVAADPVERTTAGLAELAAEATAAGTPAGLTQHGDPALASPVVSRTVRSIVSEALTNVRKHAPGAAVRVEVRFARDGVLVSVHNDAAPRAADPAVVASGSGLGLSSLRQRVELVQGTLHAGATPDGGFLLEARLPAYVPTGPPPAALVGAPG